MTAKCPIFIPVGTPNLDKPKKELARTAIAEFDTKPFALNGIPIHLPRVPASIGQNTRFVACSIQCKLCVEQN
jgi:hypothetical protein